MRASVAVLALCALLASCSTEEPKEKAQPRRGPAASPKASAEGDKKIKERKPTGPRPVRVMNDALGEAEALTRRAIADLKRLGFWDDLTKDIYGLRITSRQGGRTVPDDGHLADSLWTYYKDDATGEWGDLCDVLMFTRAIKDDVARQAVYYSQGRLGHPPPTLRQFWAVLLGHEIAHCSKEGQKGEGLSTRWEVRILEGFGIDRVGSP